MVVVAIAGGTGAVGSTLKAERSESASLERLAVDYNNADQIASVLREHGVEVVVSALVLLDNAASESQINLIRGAACSGTVTRFLPSEYHLDFHIPINGIELSFKNFQLRSELELEHHPQLTWTLLRNGLFLDYLAMPHKPKPTNLMPWSVFVDFQHEMCVFPGDGTQTMIFTHSSDLAAYVERLVSLPATEWPRYALVAGNRLNFHELADIIKRVTGCIERDFNIVYESTEAIFRGHVTQLPIEKEAMYTALSNGYDLQGEDLGKLFPDVQTTPIDDFLKDAWILKQAAEATRPTDVRHGT
ncbi:hypothetical protein Micbo1qcDRAFT_174641 [Microdochium bolleyi]|uniref:Uncharacterized protein n=1 Tax=Microdochium bolleyi TaxID=196109 RepID=A0A136J8X9_9PEZI|nr:hypothetical protein Micbo1qcDRAFT_174641 [Microdochium bolleyi]